ncbi:MAG: WD40 repeat domain-containing protein, partial [Acidobacteriota bacterium]
GNRSATCRGHEAGIYTVAFHPDGEQLATGGFDGLVRICEVDSGQLLEKFIPVPIEEKLLTSN